MKTLIVLLSVIALLPAQEQYKRIHRDALKQIVNGNPGKAVATLAKRIETDPSDPEDWFMMAIAEVKRGNVGAAREAASKALQLGFPTGRFVVALHDWLAPLKPKFSAMTERVYVAMGPMVGAVGTTSAQVWLRTTGRANVTLTVGATVVKGETSPGTDHTLVLKVTGLKPDTQHMGELLVHGDDTKPWAPIRVGFKTAPEPGSGRAFRVAFGGGAGFTPKHEHMWDSIHSTRPDLLLLLGDNVYIDHPEHPDVQRFCYHRRQASKPYRKLTARTPTLCIWDDHDFGKNDCHGGPALDEPAWKRPVWNVFKQNWANPGYGGGEARPGCWYRFSYGDADFFMLDGRTYRTKPNKAGTGTMLGPHQKAWLKKELLASRAMFKVLVSPVPWAVGTKGGSKDTWDGFPDERAEIYAFLSKNEIDGVIQMTADRHRSDAWLNERPDGYPLYEFNSSRLTNIHKHRTMKKALYSYNAKPSFGVVTFTPGGDAPGVSYEIMTIDRERMYKLPVPLSKLRH